MERLAGGMLAAEEDDGRNRAGADDEEDGSSDGGRGGGEEIRADGDGGGGRCGTENARGGREESRADGDGGGGRWGTCTEKGGGGKENDGEDDGEDDGEGGSARMCMYVVYVFLLSAITIPPPSGYHQNPATERVPPESRHRAGTTIHVIHNIMPNTIQILCCTPPTSTSYSFFAFF